MASGVSTFAEDAAEQIKTLSDQLLDGAYSPHHLFEVGIPKSDGGVRTLHVPTVRDRVVERAILQAVTPIVDPHLGSRSFGYRPGLGVTDAVQSVVQLRDEGLSWVARSDVDDCFPSLPVTLALSELASLVRDADLMAYVHALMARRSEGPDGRERAVRGAPQGCSLSPLLANLVLSRLDEALTRRGIPIVRYADDFVLAGLSRASVLAALGVAADALKELGMVLGADKTSVTTFEESFTFLGEDFGPRYPPVVAGDGGEAPLKKSVYVSVQGGRVRLHNGRLLVENKVNEALIDVPSGRVSRLVLFGSVGLSAGVRGWAAGTGVDIVLASRRGSYLGQIQGANTGPRIERVKAQIQAQESGLALQLARGICDAKVTKQQILLKHFVRPDTADIVRDAVASMKAYRDQLDDCSTIQEVMGIEGASAAAYWPCYGALLPSEMQFTERSRRPPRDVVNAALSFLYVVLTGECVAALYGAGLDPAFGLLHADDGRRPSLALDLLEEFRPPGGRSGGDAPCEAQDVERRPRSDRSERRGLVDGEGEGPGDRRLRAQDV